MPEVIKSLKEKYVVSSRSEQIRILTIFARNMSIRGMMSEFSCSQRMAVQAKNLEKENGMLSSPNPKQGKILPDEVKSAVTEFYRSDEVSQIMPGKKDCMVVRNEHGKRQNSKAPGNKQSQGTVSEIQREEPWLESLSRFYEHFDTKISQIGPIQPVIWPLEDCGAAGGAQIWGAPKMGPQV